MDEVLARDDIVKNEIERLRLTVGRAVDFDQSSDDDDLGDLQVDTSDSEDVDGGRGVAQNGNHKSQKSQLGFSSCFEDAPVGGISQDSMASFSGFDLEAPANPEICLAINRAYQQMISVSLTNITTVLQLNRQHQEDVKQELETLTSEKSATSRKRTLGMYSKPYFKDASGSYPPPNDDTRLKRHAPIHDPVTRPPKTWSTEERNKLRNAVKADRLRANLRPFMNKKELEHAKLKNALPNSDEEKAILNRLNDINEQIKLIQSRTDIPYVYGGLNDSDINAIDWMKISNVDFEGVRNDEGCKLYWKNAGHPLTNTSKWLPDEDTKLVELAIKYNGVCWENIARDLGTNRTAFQCLQRYQTKLNPCLQTGKWTVEEDMFLREVVTNMCDPSQPITWSEVAYYVEGRSREQCAKRWEQLQWLESKKGRWTKEEDKKLTEYVKKFGSEWLKISKYVTNRTASQCRERWINTLDKKIVFSEWTYEEDKMLWLLVHELGEGKWTKVSDMLPGRTDNMCLQRYRRLDRWKSGIGVEELPSSSNSIIDDCENAIRIFSQQERDKIVKELKSMKHDALQRSIECSLLKFDIGLERSSTQTHSQSPNGTNETSELQPLDSEAIRIEIQGSEAMLHENQVKTIKLFYRYRPKMLKRHLEDLELILEDRRNGIIIPRGPRSIFSDPAFFDPIPQRKKILIALGIHFSQFLTAEDVDVGVKIDEFLAKCNTERNAEEQRAEKQKRRCTNLMKPGSKGRKSVQLSFEEIEVENSIIDLLRGEKIRISKASQMPKSAEDIVGDSIEMATKAKVIQMMTTAMNFHKVNFLPLSSSVRDIIKKEPGVDTNALVVPANHSLETVSNQSVIENGPADNQSVVKRIANALSEDVSRPASSRDRAVPIGESLDIREIIHHGVQSCSGSLVVMDTVASPSANTPSVGSEPQNKCLGVEREKHAHNKISTKPNTRKPLNFSTRRPLVLGELGRRLYTMPLLPPSKTTIAAFKRILLDRLRLMRIAGKFHQNGLLSVPKVVSDELVRSLNGELLMSQTKQLMGSAACMVGHSTAKVQKVTVGVSATTTSARANHEHESSMALATSKLDATAGVLETVSDSTPLIETSKGISESASCSASHPLVETASTIQKNQQVPMLHRKRGRPAKPRTLAKTVDNAKKVRPIEVSAMTTSDCANQEHESLMALATSNLVATGVPETVSDSTPLVGTSEGISQVASCSASRPLIETTSTNQRNKQVPMLRRKRGRPVKPRTLVKTVDDAEKAQPDDVNYVIKSKSVADRLMHSYRSTHDYQMMKSRFLSLFAWPALLSTLPVSEGKDEPNGGSERVVRLIGLGETSSATGNPCDSSDEDIKYNCVEKPRRYPKIRKAAKLHHQHREEFPVARAITYRSKKPLKKKRDADVMFHPRKSSARKVYEFSESQRRSTRLEYKRLLEASEQDCKEKTADDDDSDLFEEDSDEKEFGEGSQPEEASRD